MHNNSQFIGGNSKATKWLPAHFNFEGKECSKMKESAAKHFEGLAALLLVQRDSGQRSRPGVNPFISALTVARCPATFPEVWPQLRGHFVHKLEHGDEGRGLSYTPCLLMKTDLHLRLHATQAQPCFPAASNALALPQRQPHFHGNADRAYNTLHFAPQSRVPNGGVAPFGKPHKKRRYATLHGAHTAFSCYPALRPVSVEQKSAWD